jgi:hypothetical protein
MDENTIMNKLQIENCAKHIWLKKDLDKRERSLNTDNERYTNTSTIRVITMLSKIENNNALCRLKTKKGYRTERENRIDGSKFEKILPFSSTPWPM